MRTRIFFSALAAAGLWAGSAVAQQTQPGPVAPPGNSPPTNVPDNTPPRSKPGTGPATQPDNTPRNSPPGTGPATQPDNTAPGAAPAPRAVPPPAVTPGTTIGSGGTGVAPGTATTGPAGKPVAVPPDLAKLEAEAAVEVPAPQVPAGRAPEAKRVAEAAVKVRRATWVVEKLLPPPPDGVAVLNLNAIKVGARGWLDTTADVVRTGEGVTVIQPAGLTAEGVVVGVPAIAEATTTKTIPLRGEYIVDRTVTVDGREVLVLKELAAAKALEDAKSRLISAARARLEEAKAQYANALAVLTAAKKKATDDALARTQVEAAKQIPVPENATGEERIRAKKDQDELAQKLAKPELDKIAEMYGVPTAFEPTRR